MPRARPPASTTVTASPAAADPRWSTSLEKTQGWPDASRAAPLWEMRTHGKWLNYASASSRRIRSSVAGWVEKRRIIAPPPKGLMMNMCAVAGEASIGMRFE